MKKYFLLILVAMLTVSCEDYLDQREVTDSIDEETVFGTYYNIRRYLEDGYTKLFNVDATENFSTGKNHSHVSQFGDEGSTNRDRIPDFKGGGWMEHFRHNDNIVGDHSGNGLVEFTSPYILAWQGIRIANRTIHEINSPKDITEKQKKQLLN